MAVTTDNVYAVDLTELLEDVSRLTQLRYRGKDDEASERFIISVDNQEDVNQVFRYLLTASNEIADNTRATLSSGISGIQALRQKWLTENPANIELFDFPANGSKIKKDIPYQYCYDALKHLILYEWYRDTGDLEASSLHRTEGDRNMAKINNNSTTKKLFKAPYIPAW